MARFTVKINFLNVCMVSTGIISNVWLDLAGSGIDREHPDKKINTKKDVIFTIFCFAILNNFCRFFERILHCLKFSNDLFYVFSQMTYSNI